MDRNPNWISLMSECILRDLDFNRRQITDSIIHAVKSYEDIQRIDHLSNADHLNKSLPIKKALDPIIRYRENESGQSCIDSSSNKPILITPSESEWVQKDHCTECISHESESGESSESLIDESENETFEENLRKPEEEKSNINSTGHGNVCEVTTRKFKRKPTKPLKSPSRFDPSFKGVTFQLRTKLTDQKSHLKITAFYSSRKNRFPKPRHKKCYSLSHSPAFDNLSASDTEIHELPIKEKRHSFYGNTGKQCASCGTKKTPLWRDAEDGTPLCNACGIRYKKYRIRCTHCWHIPKKDSKSYPHCSNCGELLKLALFRKTL